MTRPALLQVRNWMLGSQLGVGSYGVVREAFQLKTGQRAAIKVVDKSKLKTPVETRSIVREIAIHQQMDHPNIAKVYEVMDSEDYAFVVMEVVEGGDLFQYVLNRGFLDDKQVQSLFYQMISAVKYCHDSQVAHRDIKLENFLIDKDGKQVKLTDFGLATQYTNNKLLATFCGSAYYAAPEVAMSKPYSGPASDMWSLGVTLFAMASGRLPFVDNQGRLLLDRALRGISEYPPNITPECQKVISSLLKAEPTERATMDDLFNMPWVQAGAPKTSKVAIKLEALPKKQASSMTITPSVQSKEKRRSFDESSGPSFATSPRALSTNTMPKIKGATPTSSASPSPASSPHVSPRASPSGPKSPVLAVSSVSLPSPSQPRKKTLTKVVGTWLFKHIIPVKSKPVAVVV